MTKGERTLHLPRARSCQGSLVVNELSRWFSSKTKRKGLVASDVMIKVKGEDLVTPRCSKGRKGEEIRRRFSIVGACPFRSLVRKPQNYNNSPILL